MGSFKGSKGGKPVLGMGNRWRREAGEEAEGHELLAGTGDNFLESSTAAEGLKCQELKPALWVVAECFIFISKWLYVSLAGLTTVMAGRFDTFH